MFSLWVNHELKHTFYSLLLPQALIGCVYIVFLVCILIRVCVCGPLWINFTCWDSAHLISCVLSDNQRILIGAAPSLTFCSRRSDAENENLWNASPVWQAGRLRFAAHRCASHCYNRLVFKLLFIHCELLRHSCTGISLFGATRSRGAVLTVSFSLVLAEQCYFVNKKVHRWPFFHDSDETSGS